MSTMTETDRRLVTDGDPDERFPIPSDEWFEAHDDADVLPAPEIESIGEALIKAHRDFDFLTRYTLGYVWKRKGGDKANKAVFGTCQKPSGLLKMYSRCHFIIAISADHCRDMIFSRWEMEALVYHELSHAALKMKQDGSVAPTLIGHDLEMFFGEVRHYGLWRGELERARQVFEQVRLPLPVGEPTMPPVDVVMGQEAH